jgi:hypothetical protein
MVLPGENRVTMANSTAAMPYSRYSHQAVPRGVTRRGSRFMQSLLDA